MGKSQSKCYGVYRLQTRYTPHKGHQVSVDLDGRVIGTAAELRSREAALKAGRRIADDHSNKTTRAA